MDCLGGTVNIESARKNFYTELFQHISLPRNYSFVPIIREINQTIKKYTQQQFPIIYADKGKRRLQTSAVTSKKIQPPTWKKTRVELLTNPLYYYTPRNFGTVSLWEVTELEKEESKNQEFTYQNLILENPEVETLNIQTQQPQNNPNSETINQQNLSPVIIINQPPIELIIEPI
ncbi:hypothetical protein G9A89_003466 [Geosiphon pyriformis]|nr:hypothetical protein G9A89_003466 [Geosiphon pyriformis]